jgi:hypothetical protein
LLFDINHEPVNLRVIVNTEDKAHAVIPFVQVTPVVKPELDADERNALQ